LEREGEKVKDLVNRKKLVSLSLLTALIITLVFANLNVTPTGAGGAGNPGTNMTFDSNVTMEFEPGNITWIGSGFFLEVKNATAGENMTEIVPGTWLRAKERPGWWFKDPEPGEWWYIYGALYGKYIAFKIDYAYGPVVGHTHFNVSEVYDHWLRIPRNFTGPTWGFAETPVEMFEAERMLSTIEIGVDYLAYLDFTVEFDPPPADSWWTITYHDSSTGRRGRYRRRLLHLLARALTPQQLHMVEHNLSQRAGWDTIPHRLLREDVSWDCYWPYGIR